MQSMFTTSSPCLCGRGGRDGLVHDFIGGYSSIDATRKDQRGGPSPSNIATHNVHEMYGENVFLHDNCIDMIYPCIKDPSWIKQKR